MSGNKVFYSKHGNYTHFFKDPETGESIEAKFERMHKTPNSPGYLRTKDPVLIKLIENWVKFGNEKKSLISDKDYTWSNAVVINNSSEIEKLKAEKQSMKEAFAEFNKLSLDICKKEGEGYLSTASETKIKRYEELKKDLGL